MGDISDILQQIDPTWEGGDDAPPSDSSSEGESEISSILHEIDPTWDGGAPSPEDYQQYTEPQQPTIPLEPPKPSWQSEDEPVRLLGQWWLPEIQRSTPFLGGLSKAISDAIKPTQGDELTAAKIPNPLTGEDTPIRDYPGLGGVTRLGEMAANIFGEAEEAVGKPGVGLALYGAYNMAGTGLAPHVSQAIEALTGEPAIPVTPESDRRAQVLKQAGYSSDDEFNQALLKDPGDALRRVGMSTLDLLPEQYPGPTTDAAMLVGSLAFDPLDRIPNLGVFKRFQDASTATELTDVAQLAKKSGLFSWLNLKRIGMLGETGEELASDDKLFRQMGRLGNLNPLDQPNLTRATGVSQDTAYLILEGIQAQNEIPTMFNVARQIVGASGDLNKLREMGMPASVRAQRMVRLLQGAEPEIDKAEGFFQKALDAINAGDNLVPADFDKAPAEIKKFVTAAQGSGWDAAKMQRELTQAVKTGFGETLRDVVNKNLKTIYNLQPPNLFDRILNSIKNVEAILFMGLNPTSLVRNILNNKWTLLNEGLDAFANPKDYEKFLNKLGVSRQMLEGALEAGMDLRGMVGKGSRVAGMGGTLSGKIGELGSKYTLLKAYQKFEREDRFLAFVSGMKRAATHNMRIGKFIRELDPAVAAQLGEKELRHLYNIVEKNALDPNFKQKVVAALKNEMIGADWTPTVRDYMPQLQQALGGLPEIEVLHAVGLDLETELNKTIEAIKDVLTRERAQGPLTPARVQQWVDAGLAGLADKISRHIDAIGRTDIVTVDIIDNMMKAMLQVGIPPDEADLVTRVVQARARAAVLNGEARTADEYMTRRFGEWSASRAPQRVRNPSTLAVDSLREEVRQIAQRDLHVPLRYDAGRNHLAVWSQKIEKARADEILKNVTPVGTRSLEALADRGVIKLEHLDAGQSAVMLADDAQVASGKAGAKGLHKWRVEFPSERQGFQELLNIFSDPSGKRAFEEKEGATFNKLVEALKELGGPPPAGMSSGPLKDEYRIVAYKGKDYYVPNTVSAEDFDALMPYKYGDPSKSYMSADRRRAVRAAMPRGKGEASDAVAKRQSELAVRLAAEAKGQPWVQKAIDAIQEDAEGVFWKYARGDYKKKAGGLTGWDEDMMKQRVADADRMIRTLSGDARGLDFERLGTKPNAKWFTEPETNARLYELNDELKTAITRIGVTDRPQNASFILPDGQTLGMRNHMAHSEIVNHIDPSYQSDLYGFMSANGVVRVSEITPWSASFEITGGANLTQEQVDKLVVLGMSGSKKVILESADSRTGKILRTLNVAPEEKAILDGLSKLTGGRFYELGERGSMAFDKAGHAMVRLIEGKADVGTALHEMWHAFMDDLNADDLDRLAKASGSKLNGAQLRELLDNAHGATTIDEEFRRVAEQWANWGVDYLKAGLAPANDLNDIFDKFRVWLKEIWDAARGASKKVPTQVREIMDDLLVGRGAGAAHTEYLERGGSKVDYNRAIRALRSKTTPATGSLATHANLPHEWAKSNGDLFARVADALRPALTADFVQPRTAYPVSDALRKDLLQYVDDAHASILEGRQALFSAGRWAEKMSVLNYTDRYNFDNWSNLYAPFAFWRTHSAMNWAQRFIDRPAQAAFYFRALKMLEEQNQDANIPERLRGRLEMPMPLLPDWMGKSLFVDPLASALPLKDIFLREAQQAQFAQVGDAQIAAMIRTMQAREEISDLDAETALTTKKGILWTSVKQQLTQQAGNPLASASDIFQPHLPTQVLAALWRGQPEDVGVAMPVTRLVKGVTALAGVNKGQGWNIEGWYKDALRQLTGDDRIPLYDAYDDYRVERAIRDGVANKLYKERDAVIALMEHKGPVWDDAAAKAAAQSALPNLLSGLGRFDIFPKGEAQYYVEAKIRSKVMEAELRKLNLDPATLAYGDQWAQLKAAGRTKRGTPLGDIYTAFPSLAVTSDLYKTQEGRLRYWLDQEVRDMYWDEIGALDKRVARAQLGPEFENFINGMKYLPEGMSFKEWVDAKLTPVSIQKLAEWTQFLNGYVPKPEGIRPINIALDKQLVKQNPALSRAYDEYVKGIDHFGGEAIFQKQEAYFALPEHSPERRAYAAANPDLSDPTKGYWAWKRGMVAKYPALFKLLDQLEKNPSAPLSPAAGTTSPATPPPATVPAAPRAASGGGGGGGGGGGSAPRSSGGTAYRSSYTPNSGYMDFADWSPTLLYKLDQYFRGLATLDPTDIDKLLTLWRRNPMGARTLQAWLNLIKSIRLPKTQGTFTTTSKKT